MDNDKITKSVRHLRIIVLGALGVGKSSVVKRLLKNEFSSVYIPTAQDLHVIQYNYSGRSYKIEILDQSGSLINSSQCSMTLMTGDVFLIVYDVSKISSFLEAVKLRIVIILCDL